MSKVTNIFIIFIIVHQLLTAYSDQSGERQLVHVYERNGRFENFDQLKQETCSNKHVNSKFMLVSCEDFNFALRLLSDSMTPVRPFAGVYIEPKTSYRFEDSSTCRYRIVDGISIEGQKMMTKNAGVCVLVNENESFLFFGELYMRHHIHLVADDYKRNDEYDILISKNGWVSLNQQCGFARRKNPFGREKTGKCFKIDRTILS